MLKRIIVYHVFPIILASILVVLSYPVLRQLVNGEVEVAVIQGKQTMLRSWLPSLTNENDEIQFVASIKNETQLTLFGSSEFSSSPFVPYNFFPDSLGVPAIGIGRAYHQSLSVLIELLATHEYNKGAKICVFLSPGWFEEDGTNIQAFIEFARPNFLKNIYNNNEIQLKYKKHIGQYIYSQRQNVENISQEMNRFLDFSGVKSIGFLNDYFVNLTSINNVRYKVENDFMEQRKWNGNYDELARQVQTKFIDEITTNKLYVSDEYYRGFVLDKNGNERSSQKAPIDIVNNKEYTDFKLLVDYISERKMEASFVMIPFNPYYYKNTEVYQPLMDSINQTLSRQKVPFCNLFAIDKATYEPGTLLDVMHLGDYGWMKVNTFLAHLYLNNEK